MEVVHAEETLMTQTDDEQTDEQYLAELVAPKRRERKALTPEQEQEIIQMYGDHSVPIDEILTAYDINTPRLYGVLKRHGVKPGRHKYRIAAGLNGQPVAATQPVEENPVQHETEVMTAIVPIPPPPAQSLNGTRSLKGWHISFTVTKHVFMSAPDAIQAIQRLVEQEGEGVEVTTVQQV